MNKKEFEELLKFLADKKIKGKDFAKWLGVTPTTLSKWSSGKAAPSPLVKIVFEYLKFIDMLSIDLKAKIK